jgi:hypothetical protein
VLDKEMKKTGMSTNRSEGALADAIEGDNE